MPVPATAFSESKRLNPLDVLEQIVCDHEWTFERRGDLEMAAEAPGVWCHYGLYFSWSPDIPVLSFTCAFDLKTPVEKRKHLYELVSLANDRLWLGHFHLDAEAGVPMFRHSILLRGVNTLSVESMEDMIEVAISECERFYPAFQHCLWGGKNAAEALDAAMTDCKGEA